MDISGIGSSALSSLSPEILAQMREARQGGSSEEFASTIINEKDGDSDGKLSLSESGRDQDFFNQVDADGDGYLTQEEIAADMDKRKQEMDAMMGGLNMRMQGMGEQGMGGQDFASSLISESDADGDGALDLEESGLSEELFGALDADGDGSLTTEELEAAMQPPDGMRPPEMQSGEAVASAVTASGSAATTATSASDSEAASTSSSSSDDEEYDAYDLNEDGMVTMDELRTAFAQGDISLKDLFEAKGETGEAGDGQSALMRMAMRAYNSQNMDSASLSQAVA